jgi:hypothetical protein
LPPTGNRPAANAPTLSAPASSPSLATPRPTTASAGSAKVVAPTPAGSVPVAAQQSSPVEQIVLQLSTDAKRPIDYTINGTAFQLAPGNSVRMQPGMNWKVGIQNRRSEDKVYELAKPGIYTINRTEDGWVIDSKNKESLAARQNVTPATTSPNQSPALTPPEPATTNPATTNPAIAKPATKNPTPRVTTAAKSSEPPSQAVESPQPKPEAGTPKSVLEFNKKSDQ